MLACAEIINHLIVFNQAGPLVLPAFGELAQLGPDVAQELRAAATGVNALVYARTVEQPEMTEAALAYLGCCGHLSIEPDEQEHLVTALGLMLKAMKLGLCGW